MRPGRLSPSALPVKHRLPLLMGILLLGTTVTLVNLTQKLASRYQQSSSVQFAETCTAANDPAVKNSRLSRQPYTPASAVLTQFNPAKDPAVDAAKVGSGNLVGHLVSWRRLATTPEKTPDLPRILLAKEYPRDPQPTLIAEEHDIVESYAYVVKPAAFHQFENAVNQIGVFWTLVNEAPPDGVIVG